MVLRENKKKQSLQEFNRGVSKIIIFEIQFILLFKEFKSVANKIVFLDEVFLFFFSDLFYAFNTIL